MEDKQKTLIREKDQHTLWGSSQSSTANIVSLDDYCRSASTESIELQEPFIHWRCMLHEDLFIRLLLHVNNAEEITDNKVNTHFALLTLLIERVEEMQSSGITLPEVYEGFSPVTCRKNLQAAYDKLKAQEQRNLYTIQRSNERLDAAYTALEELFASVLEDGVITQNEKELLLKSGQKLGYSDAEITSLILKTQKSHKDAQIVQTKITIKGDGKQAAEQEKVRKAEESLITGERLYYGIGVTQNYRQAIAAYIIAAEHGNGRAAFTLGVMYLLGKQTDRNVPLGFEWLLRASQLGNRNAKFQLYSCYQKGIGVTKDKPRALLFLKEAAELGDPEAQNELGIYFRTQDKQDEESAKQAFRWFFTAANAGNPAAICNLGECYQFGIGVERNDNLAYSYFQKAAEYNLTEAQNNIGICYRYGVKVAKNDAAAVSWFEKAAEQDDAFAQFNLALCYHMGKGVKLNEQKAFELYRLSAEKGVPAAVNNLGICYLLGKGTQKNLSMAFQCFVKASEMDDVKGMVNLGECYASGIGVKKNQSTAKQYFTKAADTGNKVAAQKLQGNKSLGKLALLFNAIIASMLGIGIHFTASPNLPSALPYFLIIFSMGCLVLYARRKPYLATDGMVHLSVSVSTAEMNMVNTAEIANLLQQLFQSYTTKTIVPIPFMGFIEWKNNFDSIYKQIREAGEDKKALSEAVQNTLALEPYSLQQITNDVPECITGYKIFHNEMLHAIKESYLPKAYLLEDICQLDEKQLEQCIKELIEYHKAYKNQFTELREMRGKLLARQEKYGKIMNEFGILGITKSALVAIITGEAPDAFRKAFEDDLHTYAELFNKLSSAVLENMAQYHDDVFRKNIAASMQAFKPLIEEFMYEKVLISPLQKELQQELEKLEKAGGL